MGEIADTAVTVDEDWTVEHRFRAVVEVLDGAPVAESPAGTGRRGSPCTLGYGGSARADGTG